jgi:hypothetical protein
VQSAESALLEKFHLEACVIAKLIHFIPAVNVNVAVTREID